MSYTPKQQGTGESVEQQQQQQSKPLSGISQQMQNLLHGQNALPETSQSSLGAVNFTNLNMTLQQQQQQRFESIIKQQQLLFSAAGPQIQHFQQQSAKDLLNKSLQHQQQANGNTSASLASNLANQQFHQQLQALAQNPTNLMQHLQAYQFQMQQQQQQKMLPLNQTQQSLNSCPIDVQNVTQQHMQQIQQTLQQQKLLMSHTKPVPPTNQVKSVALGTSTSILVPNSSSQMQLDNINKTTTKGTVASVQAKQISSSNSAKTLQIQTKACVTPSVNTKQAQPSQTPVKSTQVNYPSKVQSVSASVARTSCNTSSSLSRPITLDQQPSKSIISHSIPVAPKAQNIQHSLKTPANINTSSESSKHNISTLVDGASSSTTTSVAKVEDNVEFKKSEELKSLENTKKESEQKDKTTSDTLKDKESKESVTRKLEVCTGKTEELSKDKECIQLTANKPAHDSELSVESGSQGTTNNKTVTNSEKSLQKVSFKVKAVQRKNITKNEQEKVEIVLESETISKEQKEKEKIEPEDKSDEQNQRQQQQHCEKDKGDILSLKEKIENEKEKTVKSSKVNKEKSVNDFKGSKTEKKENSSTKDEPIALKADQLAQQFSATQNYERRSKRHRLKTILYQSPLPELAYITKLSVSETSKSLRNVDEKLILFYKTEYLAVRNAEDGFFICKTLQNIYKNSKRIRIRWFSEEKKGSSIYKPDFYDNTDLECILTTVEMEKMSKDRFKLSKAERTRIENILKKAMDVEKGITPRPDITEENPDGLDISLLKTESQLLKGVKRVSNKFSKRNRMKFLQRKKGTRKKFDINEDNSQEDENEDEYDNNDTEYKPKRNRQLDISFDIGQPKLRRQRSSTRARKTPVSLKQNENKQSMKLVPLKTFPKTNRRDNSEGSQQILSTNKKERPKRKAVESVISYDEGLVGVKRLTVAKQTKKDEIPSKANDKDDAITILLEDVHTLNTTELTVVSKSEVSDILPSTLSSATKNTSKTLTNPSFKKKKISPSACSVLSSTTNMTSDTIVSSASSKSKTADNELTPSFDIQNRSTKNRK